MGDTAGEADVKRNKTPPTNLNLEIKDSKVLTYGNKMAGVRTK